MTTVGAILGILVFLGIIGGVGAIVWLIQNATYKYFVNRDERMVEEAINMPNGDE